MTNLLKAKSKFRAMGISLMADGSVTINGKVIYNFATEDNFIKTIQKPLVECGLEIVATMTYNEKIGKNAVLVRLWDIEMGEYIESLKVLDNIQPKTDRNGNRMYFDAEIEEGKRFGYWSRVLAMRLLGISDIENPENILEDISEVEKIDNDLNETLELVSDKDRTLNYFLEKMGKKTYRELTISDKKTIINAIKAKKREK